MPPSLRSLRIYCVRSGGRHGGDTAAHLAGARHLPDCDHALRAGRHGVPSPGEKGQKV